MGVDDLSNGDVDDRLGDGDQVRVLVHVELVLQRGNVTRRQEEAPVATTEDEDRRPGGSYCNPPAEAVSPELLVGGAQVLVDGVQVSIVPQEHFVGGGMLQHLSH